jgi:hypothetical protein
MGDTGLGARFLTVISSSFGKIDSSVGGWLTLHGAMTGHPARVGQAFPLSLALAF